MPDDESLHEQLISQARRMLANQDPERPRQVDLRRAISAAYYALFYFLIDEACREFLGGMPEDKTLRTVLSRAFDHGEMAEASKPFKGQNLKPGLKARFGEIPESLAGVAETFIDLQDERHRADYDLTASFDAQATATWIDRSEEAMTSWAEIREQPTARLYLVMLLAGGKLKNRKWD